MTIRKIFHTGLLIVAFLAMTTATLAQVVDRSPKVDTLSLADRLSVRTNLIDWTLLLPNIGVEFDIRNTNWSRWAIGLTLRDNWQTSHTFKPGIVYNMAEARLDFRNYWRTRQIDQTVKPHKHIWDKAFSARRRKVKHPTVTYYKGVYLSYTSFSFKFGREGHQGNALTAGFTYGFVKPLYTFPSGRSLDLDMGLSAGFAFSKSDTYVHDRESNCYPVTETGKWKFVPYPVLTEARIGFVYRLGKYPVTKKYRWRYDADPDFMARVDSIDAERTKAAIDKKNTDSISKQIYDTYWTVYDSIARQNAEVRQKQRLKAAGEAEIQKATKKSERKTDAKDARKDSLKKALQEIQPADTTMKKLETTVEAPADTTQAPAAAPATNDDSRKDEKPAEQPAAEGQTPPEQQAPPAGQTAPADGQQRKEDGNEA